VPTARKAATPEQLDPTKYATVKEAAEMLGVNSATVRRWIDAELIKAYRLGPRMLRVKRSDLDALLSPIDPQHSNGNGKGPAKTAAPKSATRKPAARKPAQNRRK